MAARAFGILLYLTWRGHCLQTGGLQATGKDKQLPKVADVLKRQSDLLQQMTDASNHLQLHMQAVQRRDTALLVEAQRKHQASLTSQDQRNHQLEVTNAAIESAVYDIRTNISYLRAEAARLEHNGDQLRDDINSAIANMSSAEEVLNTAIAQGQRSLGENVSELLVVRDLVEKDRLAAQRRASIERLEEIKGAMLQTGTQSTPQDILRAMLASMSASATEQASNLARLQAKFDSDFQEKAKRTTILLEEQTQLNATLVKDTARLQRLENAVVHLRNADEQLREQSKAVRKFAQALGTRKEVNGSVSKLPEIALADVRNNFQKFPLRTRFQASRNRTTRR
jgi:predicted nuclease with TOPRIM domain